MSRGFAVAANVKAEVVAAAARDAPRPGSPRNGPTPDPRKPAPGVGGGGARAAGRPGPGLFGSVRLAMGPGAPARVAKEGGRYAAIPAYKANFDRMGVKPEATAIVADTPAEVARALARWDGVIDEVILRALPADDGVESTLALVRAAKP